MGTVCVCACPGWIAKAHSASAQDSNPPGCRGLHLNGRHTQTSAGSRNIALESWQRKASGTTIWQRTSWPLAMALARCKGGTVLRPLELLRKLPSAETSWRKQARSCQDLTCHGGFYRARQSIHKTGMACMELMAMYGPTKLGDFDLHVFWDFLTWLWLKSNHVRSRWARHFRLQALYLGFALLSVLVVRHGRSGWYWIGLPRPPLSNETLLQMILDGPDTTRLPVYVRLSSNLFLHATVENETIQPQP